MEQELYNVLTSSDFSWYWNEAIIHGEKEDIKDSFQFTHTFIVNNNSISNWLNLVLPIVYLLEKQLDIKIKSIHRIKANLTTKTIITKSDIKNLYHINKNYHKVKEELEKRNLKKRNIPWTIYSIKNIIKPNLSKITSKLNKFTF